MSKTKKPALMSDQLQAAIAESGLSSEAVAQRSGVTHDVVMRLLSGQRDIRLETADKIAAFFGMTLSAPLKTNRRTKRK